MRAFLILMIICSTLPIYTEEVLSTRPVVIAPRRIEAKSVDVSGRSVVARSEKPAGAETDESKALLLMAFRRGSIRLTDGTQKQLMALGIRPGQRLRVFGFGDPDHSDAERIANLRARVVASYLREKIGQLSIEIHWSEKPHRNHAGIGAILEGEK
ncbi:hypothetical protein [Turneriella parva]|uniref:OmpA-like domain-containing protein n=1 Tax=Turneriella parva (strain ATCC BAA-1111 / DSM 21527 / NCTC 11395 / H) TaxID=869212 RepID=I4B0N8_TURPD|nr:hypothetical protein [Turneriella parva]AFM10845.1 hypothetical protein Turpa_0183 [Turneriella parva DSM 21527]